MTVRELITKLLDMDMNKKVIIKQNSFTEVEVKDETIDVNLGEASFAYIHEEINAEVVILIDFDNDVPEVKVY